jgi:uncharacterized protein YcfJ
MNMKLTALLGLSALGLAATAGAQVTFYEGEGFRGRAFTTNRQVNNFQRAGFNDRASSVIVDRGLWEVCEDPGFQGRCVMLRTGNYDSLRRMGLNDRVSSMRQVDRRRSAAYRNDGPEPLDTPNYDYRRRANEPVYEARVTSVHAVLGPPEQRCWVERDQVSDRRRDDKNVGGAIIGAILGGVLGHQIGDGRTQDAATVGGAAAGAIIGSNAGRDDDGYRNVRRCETIPDGPPDYWDVTYDYNRMSHRAQMSYAPGITISVNRNGEPRQ